MFDMYNIYFVCYIHLITIHSFIHWYDPNTHDMITDHADL